MARKTKAQKKFKRIGQPVIMTRRGKFRCFDGRSRYPRARVTTGIIVGYDRSGSCIHVLRTGYKCAHTYHIDFWKPVPNILYLSYDSTGYSLWEGKPAYFSSTRAYHSNVNNNTVRLLAKFCVDTFEHYTGIKWRHYGWKCERVSVGINLL